MAKIRFGPAGLGGVKESIENLEEFNRLGLRACEIAFTHGIYIKENETAEIKKAAEKFNIKLSIHAPYWINLNSKEEHKIEQSKKRIIDCCKIGHLLGADKIVFHPGYYGKDTKEETYNQIKKEITELQEIIKKNSWKVKIAPETTGKLNVFGSIDEILSLIKDTGCSFTIDFAHLWARSNGKMRYEEMLEYFKVFKELHCHFSGIDFGEKGEKNHKVTPRQQLKELLSELIKTNKEVTIINESPMPVKDSVLGLRIMNELT